MSDRHQSPHGLPTPCSLTHLLVAYHCSSGAIKMSSSMNEIKRKRKKFKINLHSILPFYQNKIEWSHSITTKSQKTDINTGASQNIKKILDTTCNPPSKKNIKILIQSSLYNY